MGLCAAAVPLRAVPAAASAPPQVIQIQPVNASVDVWRYSDIDIGFNQKMDPGTFDDESIRVVGENHGPYDGNVSYIDVAGFHVATFSVSSPFSLGERVTVTATSKVRALDQSPLFPYSWSMTIETEPGELLFTPDSAYFSARLPFELDASDVNRDGYADFAVAHATSGVGTLSVFTSRADGTLDFSETTHLQMTPGQRGIHAGDFNGDRMPDLTLTTSLDSSFVIFENNGFGFFSDTTKYFTNLLAYNIYGTDIDGDGDEDIVAGNLQGDELLFAYNDGLGNFGGFTTMPADSSPRNIECYDLNNDGAREMIVVNANGLLSVFPALGGGAFGPDITYPLGLRPASLYVNDFDLDGFYDVAVSNVQSGYLSVLFNQGDGTLAPQVTVVIDSINVGPGKNTLFEVFGGDLDGDGDIDLATADWFIGRFFVLENDGSGGFSIGFESDSVGIGLQNIVGSDFDRDGDMDLIVTNWASGLLNVFRNGTAGASSPDPFPAPYSVSADPNAPVTAQFSTAIDGPTLNPTTVFVATNLRGIVPTTIFYDQQNREMVVDPLTPFFPGEEVGSVLGPGIETATGDTLAATSWSFVVATPPGSAVFQEFTQAPITSIPTVIIPGFFNSDAQLDFVSLSSTAGEVQIYHQQAPGVFTAGPSLPTGAASFNLVANDLDADGDLDLAATDALLRNITIMKLDADTLVPAGSVSLAGVPVALECADFDNSGLPDLLVATTAPNQVEVWLNNGAAFAQVFTAPLPPNPTLLAPIDFNLDGLMDFVSASGTQVELEFFRNTGADSFAADTSFSTGGFDALGIEVGDVSGDGLPDIVVANSLSSDITVVLSTGNGYTLLPPIPLANPPSDLRLGDVNGDGELDIASVSPDDANVVVLFGEGGGAFGVDSVYVISVPAAVVMAGEFIPNGRLDIALGAASDPTVAFLLNDPATDVESAPPRGSRLFGARPNPATPSTTIFYDLAEPAAASIRVYDTEGRLVRTLVDQPQPAGGHRVTWDGRTRMGERAGSGVYFYRVEAGSFHAGGKIVLMR